MQAAAPAVDSSGGVYEKNVNEGGARQCRQIEEISLLLSVFWLLTGLTHILLSLFSNLSFWSSIRLSVIYQQPLFSQFPVHLHIDYPRSAKAIEERQSGLGRRKE